jgi:hypothetical protein
MSRRKRQKQPATSQLVCDNVNYGRVDGDAARLLDAHVAKQCGPRRGSAWPSDWETFAEKNRGHKTWWKRACTVQEAGVRASLCAEKRASEACFAQLATTNAFERWWRTAGCTALIGIHPLKPAHYASVRLSSVSAWVRAAPRAGRKLNCAETAINALVCSAREAAFKKNPSVWGIAKKKCPRCGGKTLLLHESAPKCTNNPECTKDWNAVKQVEEATRARMAAAVQKRSCRCGCWLKLPATEVRPPAGQTDEQLTRAGQAGRCVLHSVLRLSSIALGVARGSCCDGCDARCFKCKDCGCFDCNEVVASIRTCAKCVEQRGGTLDAAPTFAVAKEGAKTVLCTPCRGVRRVATSKQSTNRRAARHRDRSADAKGYIGNLQAAHVEYIEKSFEQHVARFADGGAAYGAQSDSLRCNMGLSKWTMTYSAFESYYTSWKRRHYPVARTLGVAAAAMD